MVLINFFVPDVALISGWRLIKGGAYSSKYGIWTWSGPRFPMYCTILANIMEIETLMTVKQGERKQGAIIMVSRAMFLSSIIFPLGLS